LYRWLILAGLAAAVLLADVNRPEAREQVMALPETKTVAAPAIPPLDALAPARTETATFALG
jgi:hypothetical protein